ncbi:MAG: hypothetical protein MJ187_04070 [Alphaproteobacteria bacterium]|nr:hypothetical protein [Alphaproteobacteria bacterium]
MKKLTILTSILAFAACGGGSGSGGHGGVVPGDIEKPFVPVEDTVAKSNSAITSMVSNSEAQVVTYVVNKLGNDAESVELGNTARTATSRAAFVPSSSAGNMNYDKAKELMELAQWLGDDETTHADIVSLFNKSKTDQNKIKSALKLLNDMYCYVGGDADETARRILEKRKATDFDKPMAELQQHSEIMTLDGVDLFTSQGDRLKFNVDKDGKIVSYEYPDYLIHDDNGSVSFKDGYEYPMDDDMDGLIIRKDGTNLFVQECEIPLSEMKDEDPDLNIVSVKNITDPDGKIVLKLYDEYISYGKQLGLKYADFGIMKNDFAKAEFDASGINDAGKQEFRDFLDSWGVEMTAFAGGYASKKISDDDMATLANNGDITFTGTAVAGVRYRDGYAYNGNGIDVPLTDDLMTDDGATLVFNKNGKQTLTADFSNDWYKIQAIKDTNGTNQLVVFGDKNGDKIIDDNDRVIKKIDVDGDGTVRTYDFTIATSPSGLTGEPDVVMSSPQQDSHKMTFTTGYYGNNKTPSEATATMHYQYGNWESDEHNGDGNINIELGFGGTRQ